MSDAVVFVAVLVFFFLSMVTHEVAHGWVALRCGDTTARDAGRLSFNPLVHVDPVFTVVVPIVTTYLLGFPFGGAKPVPVRPGRLHNPRLDDIKVTAAGPASNFLIAIALGLLMHLPILREEGAGNGAMLLLGVTVFANLFLAVFNLLPVPPLDGSHIVAHFLPEPVRTPYRAIGSFGVLILVALIAGVPAVGDGMRKVVYSMWNVLGHPTDLLVDIMVRFDQMRRALFGG